MKLKIKVSQEVKELALTNEVTWKDVVSTLADNGVDIPSPHIARIGETRGILDEQSILPKLTSKDGVSVGVLHIFVTPVESKGGADLPYREVKSLIKQSYKSEGGKEHFGNYTQKTTKELNKLWLAWHSSNNTAEEENIEIPEQNSSIEGKTLVACDTEDIFTKLSNIEQQVKDIRKSLEEVTIFNSIPC